MGNPNPGYVPTDASGGLRLFPSKIAALLLGVVLLYGGAAWLKSRLYGGDPTALIGFGCGSPAGCWSEFNRASLPEKAIVFRTGGYDGQFFYYVGRELYGGPPAVVDSVPFRRARIGLPVLAGPILAAGEVGRVYGLPLTLLTLHLASVWVATRSGKLPAFLVWLFALNPFSLLSFLVSTADGAALSLAVMGGLAIQSRGYTRGVGALLLAAAVLTKETLVIVPASLAAAWLLDTRLCWRTRIGLTSLAATTALPMWLWSRHVGFSAGLAASHGSLPLTGLITYLPRVDLTRAVLMLSFVLAVPTGILLLRIRAARAAGFALLGTAALVSTATASEYWSTIANIARLFTPMAAAPLLLTHESLSGSPIAKRWLTRLGGAWALSLLVLSTVTVVREATRKPLPFTSLSQSP